MNNFDMFTQAWVCWECSVTFSALDKYGESLWNGLNKCWYDDDDDDDDGEVDGEDEDEYVLAGYGT